MVQRVVALRDEFVEDPSQVETKALVIEAGNSSLNIDSRFRIYELLIGRRAEVARTQHDRHVRIEELFLLTTAIETLETFIRIDLCSMDSQELLEIAEGDNLPTEFRSLMGRLLNERHVVLSAFGSKHAEAAARIKHAVSGLVGSALGNLA